MIWEASVRFASLYLVSKIAFEDWYTQSYHVITCPELLPTARKLRKGKIMVTQKHQIGTPLFVHLRRNFGACPSRDKLYKVREAQYLLRRSVSMPGQIELVAFTHTYEFPAEKIEVTRSALVM